jgi:UDP-glucuronate decarboxylase
MRTLVTGGAGFIGSHLCERLLSEGDDVVCLDNFFTGSKKNISHLLSNRNFELIRHDITEPILLEVDRIFNLACPASPVHYQYNPVKTVKTSVNPIGIRSCYDEGKRVAETLMMDYHRQNNVDVRIIRIFNTYGPRMAENDGRVVSNFIVQALKGNDITVYGDGSQTRSFCFVSDLVDGIVRMMNCDGFTGPVNLGNPSETTILEFAERIIRLTGSKSRIIFKPLPPDDPKQRQPDISLAQDKLGWKPAVPVEEGLKKTIEYFSGLISM